MKNSTTILLSLLAATGAAFGQTAANLTTPVAPAASGSGTHQFVLDGLSQSFTLCTYEMCQRAAGGDLEVRNIAGGSTAAVVAQASLPDQENFLVFYPAGKEGVEEERRILRHRYLVELRDGANLSAIQARCGIKKITLFSPGLAVCEEESAAKVLSQLNVVAGDPDIVTVEPLFARKKTLRFAPADPFFPFGGRGDLQYQWYLKNTGQNGGVAGVDINVEPVPTVPPVMPAVSSAWDIAKGDGIDVAVVDDGVAIDHPDLMPNVPATQPHLNLVDNNDPTNPATLDESLNHGTAVAGLLAAKSNTIGMAGAAFNARISGIRLLGGFFDDVDEALALGFRPDVIEVSNNSWGPSDATLSFSGPGLAATTALRRGAIGVPGAMPPVPAGRGGKGTVYVWSAGDGGAIRDNSNYDGYANSIYTIAVGAIADSGRKAPYSERGANLVVSAPSSGGAQDVLTTRFTVFLNADGMLARTYIPDEGAVNYTTTFGGTSAAAPLVSGVVALMLEANPNLGWRDVQDLLIRTARRNDPVNGDWIDNGAGLHFNHEFGAGLVDATAAVNAARTRGMDVLGAATRQEKFTLFRRNSTDPAIPNGVVPDGTGSAYLATFDFSNQPNLDLEHVQLNLTAITLNRSDLEVVLISPSGTQSILQESDRVNKEQGISNWTFSTVRNWGEDSAGIWVLRVVDRIPGNPAILNDATITLHGVPDPTGVVMQEPILVSSKLITVNQGQQFSYLFESVAATGVSVGDIPVGLTFDPATGILSGASAAAGAFQIPIILTGDGGTSASATITLVVRPVAVALGSALGLPEYPAVTGGDVAWAFEFTDTNDGNVPLDQRLAARSGEGLDDNQESTFGFNGLPQKVLMFDWKTSSEEGADRLWFNLGGTVPQSWRAFLSGERGWGTTAIRLPAASNSVRWIYTKDGNGTVGQDRGLIDNVRLIDIDKYFSDVNAAANIVGFTPEFDSRMLWMPVEFPNRSPFMPGGKPMALRSPTIGNGQTVSLSGWLDGPGEFKFLAVNFAAIDDVFEFLLDGALVASRVGAGPAPDGDRSPLTVNRAIGPGRHRIQLRFRKDFRGSDSAEVFRAPFDGVLLDDVQFIPTNGFNNFATNYGPVALLPNDDADGDGYSNYAEYAFGGDVMKSDIPSHLPKVLLDGDSTMIEYGVDTSRTDLNYVPQQSRDLTEWTDAQFVKLNRIEGGIEYYRIPFFSVNGRERLYFRVLAQPK